MTLWIVFGVMAIAAAAFVVRPMLKPGLLPVGVATGILVMAVSFLLYLDIGSPKLDSKARDKVPDMAAVVESLAARLEEESGDIDGWKMLGRSYLNMRQFDEAANAFRKALELEEGKNAQTLVDLGESMLAGSGQSLTAEIIALFENALAIEPDNPSALFWGGIAAANRNDIGEAADRWERLLATNPPPEIQQLIEQRVAEWRGVPPSASGAAQNTTAEPPANEPAQAGALSLALNVPAEVRQSLPANTTVFVIARDPKQPAPPIAVTRRQLGELPITVMLSDADAMIPGRIISTLDSVEVIARVSLTGQPAARSGDWFASARTTPGSSLELNLDQQVP